MTAILSFDGIIKLLIFYQQIVKNKYLDFFLSRTITILKFNYLTTMFLRTTLNLN